MIPCLLCNVSPWSVRSFGMPKMAEICFAHPVVDTAGGRTPSYPIFSLLGKPFFFLQPDMTHDWRLYHVKVKDRFRRSRRRRRESGWGRRVLCSWKDGRRVAMRPVERWWSGFLPAREEAARRSHMVREQGEVSMTGDETGYFVSAFPVEAAARQTDGQTD